MNERLAEAIVANELMEFLEERKTKAENSGFDKDVRIKDWKEAVWRLYDQIESLLADGKRAQTVSVERPAVFKTEEYLGTYGIWELRLTVGHDHVVFSPSASIVFGADGRVELRGDAGTLVLLRFATDPENEWQIVERPAPNMITVSIDEPALLWALKRVMLP